jgi:hypothetical protein
MLHACMAVDATGKKRYPKLGVGARFKRTVRDSLDIFGAMMPGMNLGDTRFPLSVKSELPDKRPDIADILYGIHRCAHGHGDDIPNGYELMPPVGPAASLIRMHRGMSIQLPTLAVVGLLALAVFAPENAGQTIPDGYRLTLRQHTFFIADWWGRQDDFREIIGPILSQTPSVTINFDHWWDSWKPV